MAGPHRLPVHEERVTRRLDAGAASGAAVRGYAPASPVATRGRRPRPVLGVAPVVPGGGVYAPSFTVPGDLTARYYDAGLDNITGAGLTITRVVVRVGNSPAGSAVVARLVMGGTDTVVDVTIPAGDVFGAESLSYPWPADVPLNVAVLSVGSDYAGADLVLTVLAS